MFRVFQDAMNETLSDGLSPDAGHSLLLPQTIYGANRFSVSKGVGQLAWKFTRFHPSWARLQETFFQEPRP